MKSLTQREVDEMCALHDKALRGDANGKFADFSDCDLSHLNLAGKNLIGANFESAILSQCNMDESILTGCDFSFAVMTEVNLHNAECSKCNFENALLTEARLDNTVAFDANFKNADLSHSDMFCVKAIAANFEHAVFDNSHMSMFQATQANFREASMKNCDLSLHSNLSGANLDHVNLYNSNLREASLTGANLVNMNVRNADFFMADLQSADVQNTDLSSAFNVDTTNMNGIRNFDIESYQNAKETPQKVTPVQQRQMPSFISIYQEEVGQKIDRGQWFNPMAQESYFAGRDNPLLAANAYMLGTSPQKVETVSLHNEMLENQRLQDPLIGHGETQQISNENVYGKFDNRVSNNPILGEAPAKASQEKAPGLSFGSFKDIQMQKDQKSASEQNMANKEPGKNHDHGLE